MYAYRSLTEDEEPRDHVCTLALVRRPTKRLDDKKLNISLRQRGAKGLVMILNNRISFLSLIRSEIGNHLSLMNKLTDG